MQKPRPGRRFPSPHPDDRRSGLRDPRLNPGEKVAIASETDSRFRALRRLCPTAEGELRSLAMAVETMQIGLTITDDAGNIVYTNRAEAEMHGWSVEELVGQPARMLAPSDLARPLDGAGLARVRSFVRESVNLRRDGTTFPVRLLSDVVTDADGRPIGMVTTCEDISERRRTEEALRTSGVRLAATIGNIPDAIFSVDADGRLLVGNDAFRRWAPAVLGGEAAPGAPLLDVVAPENRFLWERLFGRALHGERFSVVHRTLLPGTEEVRHFELSFNPIADGGRTAGFCAFALDASDRVRAERGLRDAERRVAEARGIIDGLWDWDLGRREISFSPRWKGILGLGERDVGNRPEEWLDRIHPDDLPKFRRELDLHLDGSTSRFECEHRLRHSDGSWRWVLARGLAIREPGGGEGRIAGSMIDVTARKAAETRLLWNATHDALTGLPNRADFVGKLGEAIARERSAASAKFAILFVDVDHFKELNDRYGHGVGDELLVAMAEHLRASVRPRDAVARLGGDEFAILAEGIGAPSEAVAIAEQIARRLADGIRVGGLTLPATASIGIAVGSGGHERPEHVLRDADSAMYVAKKTGRARWWLFDDALRQRASLEGRLREELRHALARKELALELQPVFGLVGGRILGLEALLRWDHPRLGRLGAADFVPVAEESGAILDVGGWALATGCREAAGWPAFPGGATPAVRVNLSLRQFLDVDLARRIDEALRGAGIPPSRLVLEIPEEAIRVDRAEARRRLALLRTAGIRVELDEVGVGDFSIGELARLPLGGLKLDRSFVAEILPGGREPAVLRAVASLGGALELPVNACGIETPEQHRRLREAGCLGGQGLLFSAPLRPDEARRLLAAA